MLFPFLNENYPERDMIFWPDLASSHYAGKTLEFLEGAKVPVVARAMNPPCTPQLRPIEDLWGVIKQEVYKGS